MLSRQFWEGRKVFLTGHTGFKGSWLSIWLHELGANLNGYALAPPTSPALYEIARVGECLTSTIGDICDAPRLSSAMHAADPEILFHLAAQPLVGEGYRNPVGTYATNVMGTINVLEVARSLPNLRAIVVISTDKCYANNETGQAFRESDPLGGHDPYSSSKACTELVSHAYRQSFLGACGIHLATARAGNVIGGGDWAANRLLPDLLRAFANGETARLRHSQAIRPWQHVLNPLAGYLMLAEQLYAGAPVGRAWNFGPDTSDCISTGDLASLLAEHWGAQAQWSANAAAEFPHEAKLLNLDTAEAKNILNWRPNWPLTVAIKQTAAWHRSWLSGEDMQAVCRAQIENYSKSHDNR